MPADDGADIVLEAAVAAIQRSPQLDDQAKADAIRRLRDAAKGPAMDLPRDHMSPARAEQVRRLRLDDGCSFRALAVACSEEWGTNWGSNQYAGIELCHAAAEHLGVSPDAFFDPPPAEGSGEGSA